MGDDPYPEIEDVHSYRIESCDPQRAWLRCILEDYIQNKLDEDQNQPETGYTVSELIRCVEISPGIPKLRYR